jgi:hypothetical protein
VFLLVRRAFLLDAEGVPRLSPLVEEVRIRASQAPPKPNPSGVFEFRLHRDELFSGKAGGLHAAAPKDEAVLLFFHRLTARQAIRLSCAECHGLKTSPSAASRVAERDPRTHEPLVNGIPLQATTVEREAEATMKWKKADKSWEMFRQFWPRE